LSEVPDSTSLARPPRASRARYAVLGALTGLVFGLLALNRIQDRQVLVVLGAAAVGALSGFELWRRRGWERHGVNGHLARWTVSCASAAASLSSIFALLGVFGATEFWATTAFGAATGLGFGVKTIMHMDPITDPAVLRRDGLALRIGWTIAAAMTIMAVILMLIH
jgi:hypothetical protein